MMNSIMSYVYTLVFFAIFIAILEMILPKGNNRKYVMLASGLLLTYITISPIISILSGISETKNNFSSNIKEVSAEYGTGLTDINQEQYVLNLFEKGVENDIKKRVEECGFTIENVKVEYIINEQKEITDITSISFSVLDRVDKHQNQGNVQKVSVDVSINGNKGNSKNIELTNEEKDNIRKCLSEAYKLSQNDIVIA